MSRMWLLVVLVLSLVQFACSGAEGEVGLCEGVECGENSSCVEGECVCDEGYELEEEVCLPVEQGLFVDFEDLSLEPESYWNGADGSGEFFSGGVSFSNNYNAEYGSWDGFAYSNMTDTETAGFENQYSAIVGSGTEESANYAVGYWGGRWAPGPPQILFNQEAPVELDGMYVTNTTMAYLSMLNGDDYSKKFGGESGDDPDWLILTVTGILPGGDAGDSLDFYLADFRSDDNSEDFVLDEWTFVDLVPLGELVGLEFSMSSSDTGEYGMNTPAYFAIDNLH